MTQRTAEPTHAEIEDTRDRRVVVPEPADPPNHTRTPKPDPDPPYLPGYYLG